jgi:hypothetical protein
LRENKKKQGVKTWHSDAPMDVGDAILTLNERRKGE